MRKKFTMLLASLLACVGVVKAEVNSELISKTITIGEDAVTLAEGQWYILYNHNRNACVSEETTEFKMRAIPVNDDLAENVAGKLFKLAKAETEGQYYIESGNGLYFNFVVNNASSVSEEPVAYKVATIVTEEGETIAGHFYIQHAKDNWVADGQEKDNNFVCWGSSVPTAAGGNNCYYFKPVSLTAVSLADVTYNYYVGEELKHTEVVTKQPVGSAFNAPSFGFVTFTAPEGEVAAEGNVVNLQCTLDAAPLSFSTVESPVWQTVEMHRYGSFRIWNYTGDAVVSVTEMGADKMGVVEDSKLWCFVGDHFGFKIYNKAAGFDVTLNATSGNPKVGQAVDGNDEWFFAKSEASTEANACCFTSRGVTYMNRKGEGKIGYWSDADNGSTCYFTAPETNFQPAAEEFSNLLANYAIPEGTPENVVGLYSFTKDQKSTFVNGVSAEPTDVGVMQDLYALANEIKATAAVEPGYYFVKNTGDANNNANWYLTHKINNDTHNVDNKECVWAQAPSGNLNADYVWKFETCEDGYKIQSANVGKYFQMKTATNDGDNNTYIENDYNQGNKFLLTSNVGKFSIKNSNGANIRTEGSGQVNYWSGESNETWYLIPVTELGISINEFASICLPFDVAPGEGVTAYAIESVEGTAAKLVEKEDIPAGEGAILAGNGTAKLILTEEAVSDWNNNMLEGTPVNTYVAGPAYVLANGGNDIGLYKAELNKDANGVEGRTHFLNNANKAYLPAPANATAPMFSFDRGEGTTGIDNAQLTMDNMVIYDLLGRRVEKMEKGIYIVNGKKVIK